GKKGKVCAQHRSARLAPAPMGRSRQDGGVPATAERSSNGPREDRPTPTRVRVIGRLLNPLVARAPGARAPARTALRRFFERAAPGWDQRTGAGSVDHLAPLAAA